MKTINKAILAAGIRSFTSSNREAVNVIEQLFDLIVCHLQNEDVGAVVVRGFGTFKTATRRARKGVNPKTGEKISIPAKRVLTFKPSAEVKRRIN